MKKQQKPTKLNEFDDYGFLGSTVAIGKKKGGSGGPRSVTFHSLVFGCSNLRGASGRHKLTHLPPSWPPPPTPHANGLQKSGDQERERERHSCWMRLKFRFKWQDPKRALKAEQRIMSQHANTNRWHTYIVRSSYR